jgi:CHAT domain-containing protein
MSLTGLGGWAQQFLQVGAAGFVGAMWNVHDNPARDFAQSFYTKLLAGNTIGAATLGAREEIKRYQDATWLAYTVYGHPSATVARIEEDQ